MRRPIILLLFVAAVLAACCILFVVGRRPATTVTLSDGTILRIEKVTFGKQEPYTPPGGALRNLQSKIVERLPKSWAARFPPTPKTGGPGWHYVSIVHTNLDALQIWVTRWNPTNRSYVDIGARWAEVVDEHGCAFAITTAGGENGLTPVTPPPATAFRVGFLGSASVLHWFTFEAFPRNQKQFQLRLFDDSARKLLAEYTIINPLPFSPRVTNWNARPLPVEVKDGDLTFRLASMSVEANINLVRPGSPASRYEQIKPEFVILRDGKPQPGWHARGADLFDNAGNFASKMNVNEYRSPFDTLYLCPHADAWRLAVRFYADESSEAVSNVFWKLTGIEVPAPGDFRIIDESRKLSGVSVRLGGMVGPGEGTYSNGVPISARAVQQEQTQTSIGILSANGIRRDVFHSSTPAVVLTISGITDDQRFTVRARDSKGRDYYARELQNGFRAAPDRQGEIRFLKKSPMVNPTYLVLDLPPDERKVDITIGIHNPRDVEFTFKPPKPGTNAAR